MPTGYKGVVLTGSEKVLERKESEASGSRELEREESVGLEDEEDKEIKIMEEMGHFNEVMVWGHETVMDSEDAYVRLLEEWVGVAVSVSPVLLMSYTLYSRESKRWLICADQFLHR